MKKDFSFKSSSVSVQVRRNTHRYFSQRILRLNICSVVLLSALKPAFFSAMISSVGGWSLFRIIFNMTLLGWLIRPMVLWFWHSCKLPFFASVITNTWSAIILSSKSCCRLRPGCLSWLLCLLRLILLVCYPADFPIFSALTAASTSSRRIG